MTVNQLRIKWVEILEFFQKIESITDISLKKSLDHFSTVIHTSRDFRTISTNLKGQIYGYVQDVMSTGFLIKRMSDVYLEISKGYIMPPISELGIMLEEKNPEEIRRKKIKIDIQSKHANQIIFQRIQKEQAAIGQQIKSRMEEINVAFAPLLASMNPGRKAEIKKVIQTTKQHAVIQWV